MTLANVVRHLMEESDPPYGLPKTELAYIVYQIMIGQRIAVTGYPASEARYGSIKEWEDDNAFSFVEYVRNQLADAT